MSLNVNSMVSNLYANFSANKNQSKSISKDTVKTEHTNTASITKSGTYGKTIGNVELSEAGAKYYEELKEKYSDMDFVIVSNDELDDVESKAATLADSDKTMVIIDADRIEQMAADESAREKYEGLIEDGAKQLDEMKSQIESSGASVQSYGIKINDDGTTSFFAVLKKSSNAQKERIEAKAEEKKAEQKKADKKLEKEKAAERLKEIKENHATLTADSLEELITKIRDFAIEDRSNAVRTESELALGQNIDFQG